MSGARADLPSGSVTFLFTDIEGSTLLLHELGPDSYAAALAEHRRVLREAFAAHGGVEVDTQGDAFLVAFNDATSAVGAASDAQRAIEKGPIRVRMGIHTGQPHMTVEGYVGEDVHLGARVAAAGHGGQVLMTRATIEEASGLDVSDLGEHRFKDFDRPVWIYQLGDEGFPPLKTISNSNLPRPASSFVGREREVEQITALLRNGARLVTLTGPGGTGKTRLSVEAAAELIPEFKGGVFWIALASLRNPTLVIETIARTIGAREELSEHISEREMLLVVDNLEQLVESAPDLADLVEACPNLQLLVTSRELLRVRGEVEYSVPPLADPEAVALFTARSGLPADATVAELCRRLDNLPLAVELAAARARVLSPEQILERIGDRLDLLKGGRDADPRQQTLRTAIEWSYDLLDREEQLLFARLAVFRGGCTITAAEEIAAAEIDALQSLVDKSLVRHAGERFWMLETIRELAHERFAGSREAEEIRRRHAEFFLALAERAEPNLIKADRDSWHEKLEADHDNIRAALEYWQEHEIQSALALAGAIAEFWDQRGHHPEAFRLYRMLLSSDPRPTPARAKALDGASMIATKRDDMRPAEEWAEEALRLHREQGNDHGIAVQLWGLGFLRLEAGDNVVARKMLEESVQRLLEMGDEASAMWAMRGLGFSYLVTGDPDRAQATYATAASMAHDAGDVALEAATTVVQGSIAFDQGRVIDAISLTGLSLVALRETRDPLINRSVVCEAASILAKLGEVSAAGQMLGYADAQADEISTREPWVERMNENTVEIIRRTASVDELNVMWQTGRGLIAESVLELASAALAEARERSSG